MAEKKAYKLDIIEQLVNYGPVALVTCHYEGESNIITVSWNMPVSFSPPLIAIAIGQSQYSHDLIENSREFVINVPTVDLIDAVKECGSVSGKEKNKFAFSGLSELHSIKIQAPSIKECFINIECQVRQAVDLGDHTLFSGEVVSVLAPEDVFIDDRLDIDKYKPIVHLGGNVYCELDNVF